MNNGQITGVQTLPPVNDILPSREVEAWFIHKSRRSNHKYLRETEDASQTGTRVLGG